jgi:hypothetical protein
MDPNTPSDRGPLLSHLHGLVKAGVGSIVVASATLAALPAQASPSPSTTPVSRPSIGERIAEIRKQVQTLESTATTTSSFELAAWPNWHNWRNGWGNGWPNWHNWRNWGNV